MAGAEGAYKIEPIKNADKDVIGIHIDPVNGSNPPIKQLTLYTTIVDTRNTISTLYSGDEKKLIEKIDLVSRYAKIGLVGDQVNVDHASKEIETFRENIASNSHIEFSNKRKMRSFYIFILLVFVFLAILFFLTYVMKNTNTVEVIVEGAENGAVLNFLGFARNCVLSFTACMLSVFFVELFQFRHLDFEDIGEFYRASYLDFFFEYLRAIVVLAVFMLVLSSHLIGISIGSNFKVEEFYSSWPSAVFLGIVVGIAQARIANIVKHSVNSLFKKAQQQEAAALAHNPSRMTAQKS